MRPWNVSDELWRLELRDEVPYVQYFYSRTLSLDIPFVQWVPTCLLPGTGSTILRRGAPRKETVYPSSYRKTILILYAFGK